MTQSMPTTQQRVVKSRLHLPLATFFTRLAPYSLATTSHVLFRQFLAFKIAIPFAFAHGSYALNIPQAWGVLLLLMAVAMPQTCRLGLLGIFFLALKNCIDTWPFTINHSVLEMVIALFLCLMPSDRQHDEKISSMDMIKFLMLSVYFYSGLHKLVDGYYLNGEFFALEALGRQSPLGYHLSRLLSWFGPLPNNFSCCLEKSLSFTFTQRVIVVGLSWLTIAAELALPIMVFLSPPRFQKASIIMLMLAQASITYISGEIDFGFTAFAILFLFVPKSAPVVYPALACLFLMVRPWM